jgi:two-component system sensor histidine kinase/response regulator
VPGRGSTFWFTLPLSRAPFAEAAPAPVHVSPVVSLGGARVLLAEDNPINQQVAVELLQGAGLAVDVAGNGQEALGMVKTRPYDAVLMDLQMPVMDGLQATRSIRAIPELKALPIIAMTASVMAGDRDRCIEAGMNDHVSKPISIDQLMATLARWLPGRAAVPASTAPAPATGSPLPETLDGFALDEGVKRVGGDRALYRRLLLQFHDHSSSAGAGIRAALASGDRAKARAEVHTLKGVAGTLSAKDLYAASQALEAALRRNAVSVEAEAAALEAAHARVMAAITGLPREAAPPANGAVPGGPSPDLAPLLQALDARLSAQDAAAGQVLEAVKRALNGSHGALVQELEQLVGAYNFDQARRRLAQFAGTLTAGVN